MKTAAVSKSRAHIPTHTPTHTASALGPLLLHVLDSLEELLDIGVDAPCLSAHVSQCILCHSQLGLGSLGSKARSGHSRSGGRHLCVGWRRDAEVR